MRGNYSDSGLGSQSSSSAPQSRHTSDIESKFFFRIIIQQLNFILGFTCRRNEVMILTTVSPLSVVFELSL